MASSWRRAWASVEELKGGGGVNEARTSGDGRKGGLAETLKGKVAAKAIDSLEEQRPCLHIVAAGLM